MATGSVALIVTNAMMGMDDDNGDNLRQLEVVFCGCNGNASKYFCPRIIGKYFFCPRIAQIDTKATGSVALIYTNAMRGDMTTTGTTWDNLKLSFADAIGNELIFAHELHEWTRIVAMD